MKKTLIIASIMTGVAVLATAFIAGAQTAPTVTPPTQPMILQVGKAGNVLMRGTIASEAAGVLTVNSWGGVWTVNVSSGTQIFPATAGNDLTQFKTGDFIGVQGKVSQSASWTVDATLVRDWTYRAAVTQEQKQNIQSAKGIRGDSPRDYVGTAGNVNGSAFTLSAANGTSYTVNIASGVEIVNRNWITLPLASITSGDNVRVYGVNASGTITAQIVRDVSTPAAVTKP